MTRSTKAILLSLSIYLLFLLALLFQSPRAEVSISFLGVGQGDAALIQKGDTQILIDGGPDKSVLAELGKIMPFYDRTIEKIVLTHPHSDHIAGLNEVLDRYTVKKVYLTRVLYDSKEYQSFLDKIESKKIEVEVMVENSQVSPFENGSLEFLWPGDKYLKSGLTNLNNSSIVNRFCYVQRCFLFLGDLEAGEQQEMLNAYPGENNPFSADVFKVAHHGAKNGGFEPLMELANPDYLIFSVGEKNKFGHPAAEVLRLAEKYGRILRTDKIGTITFTITGTGSLKLVE